MAAALTLAFPPAASAQVADRDRDGVPDQVDNCPLPNPSQEDLDRNGLGDECDRYLEDRSPGRGRPRPCAAAPFTGAGRNYRATSPGAPNPLNGEKWFVDPEEWSYLDWRRLQRSGPKRHAKLMWRIAREPKFRWFGKFTGNVVARVREYLARVQCQAPGSVPLMAILRGQSKQCHSATSAAAPRRIAATGAGWISSPGRSATRAW